MNCYRCGCRLTENDFCTNCGADVSRYKQIVLMSNRLYNAGLEKAQVRDLSGAISCLKECIKLNKNHIEARNLLGLVYFEIGEVVSALNEWVISKNIQPKKNIADDYLNEIQSSPGRVEAMNQTVKKFNQALAYCNQGSQDLAIIQLKKVLSLNSKYLQAHQLLALLYIYTQEWEKARREVAKSAAIDINNTITLRYMAEIDAMTNVDEVTVQACKKKEVIKNGPEQELPQKKHKDAALKSIDIKEPNGLSIVLNISIGLALGIAIAWFLILPARINVVKNDNKDKLTEYMQMLEQRNASISRLTDEKKELEQENEELKTSLSEYSGTNDMLSAYEQLTYALYLYFSPDSTGVTVLEALDKIESSDYDNGTQNFRAAYDLLYDKVASTAANDSYLLGMKEYNAGRFLEAIPYLTLAVKYNKTDANALYNLANAYRRTEQDELAIAAYEEFIEKFPESTKISKARNFLASYN